MATVEVVRAEPVPPIEKVILELSLAEAEFLSALTYCGIAGSGSARYALTNIGGSIAKALGHQPIFSGVFQGHIDLKHISSVV